MTKNFLIAWLVATSALGETKVRNSITQGAPVSAGDKGADPSATASANVTAIQAAINAGSTGVVVIPPGTYSTNATLVLPVNSNGKFQLWMEGVVLNYSGSSYALDASSTVGAAKVNLLIRGGRIVGTSAGLAGLHLQAFNKGRVEGTSFEGFTTGAGILNEGANTITYVDSQVAGNKYGVRNVGKVVSAMNYSANANKMLGGQIVSNLTWGVFEDASLSATTGPNQNNVYIGVVFEDNRTNATTSGQAFVQRCDGCGFIGNYFEYAAGNTVPNQIVLGDGTFMPRDTTIRGNLIASVGATAAIANTRGQHTIVDSNIELAATTNFFVQGAASTNTWIGINSTVGVATAYAGTDAGDTVWWGPGSSLVNGWGPSARGLSFNDISGLDQDLAINARTGTSHIVNFNDNGLTNKGFVDISGAAQFGPVTFATLGTPANNRMIFCSDCTIANPCAGGGTGALAKRLNGVWVCN